MHLEVEALHQEPSFHGDPSGLTNFYTQEVTYFYKIYQTFLPFSVSLGQNPNKCPATPTEEELRGEYQMKRPKAEDNSSSAELYMGGTFGWASIMRRKHASLTANRRSGSSQPTNHTAKPLRYPFF